MNHPVKPEPTYFISTAEPSADLYGAALIREVRTLQPRARFIGVAGPKMQQAGCEAIADLTQKAGMLTGVLGLLGTGLRLLRSVDRLLAGQHITAAAVIDSPTLHLPMGRIIRRRGVPLLYYVAPQMWAWGGWRIGKLRRRATRVAVILPFEEEFFRTRGVEAEFVGHPLFEELAAHPPDPAEAARLRTLGDPLVALLPGSRRHVVSEVLPGQLEVAAGIQARFPQAGFAISVAGAPVAAAVREALARGPSGLRVKCVEGAPGAGISAADLVLVASGTTTLEVAHHRKPMLVMYNASRVFYHLVGRWLLTTPYLSLPNILAGRQLVPEFMPYYSSTRPIAERAVAILGDAGERSRMSVALGNLADRMSGGGASARVARMLVGMGGG
ncbi:MAG: lipid-A-disaccharide synthase [Phycisphaerales bacterium]|nr:lipid-A-disaccharide synthase [Phycisphaerales bacterium]